MKADIPFSLGIVPVIADMIVSPFALLDYFLVYFIQESKGWQV
jgi:hypothetical protein